MKWVLVTFIVMVVSVLLANPAQGGTLDRGVHISSFFIAGGANGDSITSQLKYQMAIDTYIGLKNRYKTITNTYINYESGSTFNQFEVNASTSAVVSIYNTYSAD